MSSGFNEEVKEDKPFSFETIENFDAHILASIPNYDVLFDSILKVAEYFVDPQRIVYDLGCSTGHLLSTIGKKFPTQQMIGIDSSSHLLPKNHSEGRIKFVLQDLNLHVEFPNACLVFSIFTMQFLRKSNRAEIVRSIYEALPKGGALIFAEKSYASCAQMQDVFTSAYYEFKKKGFSEKEILDKERELRLILRPFTTEDNEQMLREAGFSVIECFFRYFQFAAYICVK